MQEDRTRHVVRVARDVFQAVAALEVRCAARRVDPIHIIEIRAARLRGLWREALEYYRFAREFPGVDEPVFLVFDDEKRVANRRAWQAAKDEPPHF
ncbi:hypothetical protein [Roseomonas sp. CECT 9278]|uniref:hypothetical protein n=1 Tax=Roseomonas sp. CECT 9278 TaxID=2845823 RepID=UPI001E3883B1|nr:hypothetical protein [Roseomonas sp. CECT 9278]